MADEHELIDGGDVSNAPSSVNPEDSAPSAEAAPDEEAGASAEPEGGPTDPGRTPAVELPPANWGVPGTLIVHHADRDIELVLEGDAALRLMAIFSGSKNPTLSDRLDPRTSSAHSMWLAVWLKDVVAMSWIPGLPKPARPVTIDPAPPVAA